MMFSVSHALRLAPPIPPMPIAAMFSLLPGACAPSTRLGTMAAESAAMAALAANCLRERARFESSVMAGFLPGGSLESLHEHEVPARPVGLGKCDLAAIWRHGQAVVERAQ